MASRSSFLPRLSLSRGDGAILPFHNLSPEPIRKTSSEYDLSDLSPGPQEALLSPEPALHDQRASSRDLSFHASYNGKPGSSAGSDSKRRPRVLFTGPPPPIATSTVLYRDEEETPVARPEPSRSPKKASFTRSALNTVGSVLFDRVSPSLSKDDVRTYEADNTWRSLQRRERVLQAELQYLLDVQSAGLAAHLDPNGAVSELPSATSDAGGTTPTESFHTGPFMAAPRSRAGNTRQQQHVTFSESTRSAVSGGVIPVRQPRRKPVGLSAARAGLMRTMALLADLKADEDASLTSAVSARKGALVQLRRLSGRRDNIAEELRTLEDDDDEPVARELRELEQQRGDVVTDIAELEERLVGLRNRKRWLDGRLDDVRNRREAGLSGYRGALREVESKVTELLRRPPVKPLDLEAAIGSKNVQGGGGGKILEAEPVQQSSGGVEFLRMRPERRTVDMARYWWEAEVASLELRKTEVDKERTALEKGVDLWKAAVKLVSDFETSLQKEMKGDNVVPGSGKSHATPQPEDAMYAQLNKMSLVMTSLEQLLETAEDRGWNLLICAIGAELEAFKQADGILREALRSAGFGNNDDDATTPTTQRPDGGRVSPAKPSGLRDSNKGSARMDDGRALDNIDQMPHGLRRDKGEDHAKTPGSHTPGMDRDDSENEVPPEFLAEHAKDDEVE